MHHKFLASPLHGFSHLAVSAIFKFITRIGIPKHVKIMKHEARWGPNRWTSFNTWNFLFS